MTRPLVLIPGRRSPEARGHRTPVISGGRFYADAIERAGGIPLFLPPTEDASLIADAVDSCDAMVLLGGGDVSPERYGDAERETLYGVDDFIDGYEIAAVHRALQRNIPVLAICRGHQILNVALGGSLIQHINNADAHRDTLHPVTVTETSRIAHAMGTTTPLVHSFHHQAIDRLADALDIVATADDGIIEAVEHKSAAWVVGVQWHPEDTADEDLVQQKLFDELVRQARDE